jgi:ribose 5-phosphate isomerase B
MFEKSETLVIGSDHAGFELKEFLKIKLAETGYSIRDFGAFSHESIDYPDIVHPLASAVSSGVYKVGILICGSGNGVCMTANKYSEIRAALCWNKEIARLARAHNNANILCLPARFIDPKEALQSALLFLTTEFEGGRHATRIEKIPVK